MSSTRTNDVRVDCPCCGARLLVDARLKKVISHEAPPKRSDAPDLAKVDTYLKEQAARREALFLQSTEDEKKKAQLLDRKFSEALKKSKDEPVQKPTRDIDL